MCIRDSLTGIFGLPNVSGVGISFGADRICDVLAEVNGYPCLLYTSDAADERSSVDLGGSRIIKKKNI